MLTTYSPYAIIFPIHSLLIADYLHSYLLWKEVVLMASSKNGTVALPLLVEN